MLADLLRTLDFMTSRFNRDVWMRLRNDKSEYDYICTHVDDFKIFARDPKIWIDRISIVLLIKEHGPRTYYLGNYYIYHDGQDMQTYGAHTYTKKQPPT